MEIANPRKRREVGLANIERRTEELCSIGSCLPPNKARVEAGGSVLIIFFNGDTSDFFELVWNRVIGGGARH